LKIIGRIAMRSIIFLAVLASVGFSASSGMAQQQALRGKPTVIVAPSEISGVPGHEVRAITNDFVAGAGTPRHVHPGDQWTVVQVGEITMIVNDGEPRVMKVGEMVRIPAGVPHETYNRTDQPARTLEIFVLEKGKANITMAPKAL
jgi:quercetin dioxygenase-like cupin family protein